jgi:class 3 adenylate cyclase
MRIRPFELSTRLGITGMQALKLCLFATRHGLLTMRWDLLCPHCQGAKVTSDSLTGVRDVGACESCGIQFDAQFDRNVEVTFRPASAVRKVDAPRFCFGGPHLTPHVRLQQEMQPRETRTLSMQLAPGRYRVRAQGVPGSTTLEVEAGAGSAEVHVLVDPVNVSVEPARVKGSQLTLQVANQCAEVTPLALETSKWLETACTAATVTSLMEFRDLFSNELLAPGQGIQVGQVTLMFTDLKGSTRMYEQIGDVKAFALVRDHFTVLSDCIRQADGGIVKTIGDAIMAVFDSPSRALRCALEIQHRARDIKPMDDHAVVIKIGLHTGPCIAVQQNEHLDYFGNMVNVAARAQNESVGWDIVLTEAMVRDPECAKLVTTVPGEMFETELKGIAARVRLLRLWPEGKPPV